MEARGEALVTEITPTETYLKEEVEASALLSSGCSREN